MYRGLRTSVIFYGLIPFPDSSVQGFADARYGPQFSMNLMSQQMTLYVAVYGCTKGEDF